MRNLTVKQKRLLKQWYEYHRHLNGLGVFDVCTCDEFSGDLFQELVDINDTEILASNINHFISKLAMDDERPSPQSNILTEIEYNKKRKNL